MSAAARHFSLASAAAAAMLAVLPHANAAATRPSTQPTGAIAAYIAAAALIDADFQSPANGVGDDEHPPYSDAWKAAARAAWQHNGPVRAVVRRARGLPPGTWPDDGWYVGMNYGPNVRWLNDFRALTNDLADAAELALLDGRQNEALDLLDDLDRLHGVLMVDPGLPGADVRLYVASGIDAVRCYRTLIVAPQLDLSPAAKDAVPPRRVRQIMASFAGLPAGAALAEPPGLSNANAAARTAAAIDRRIARKRDPSVLQIDRVAAERAMAMLSLACQSFRQDTGRWPAAADELVPKYLSTLPTDPFTVPQRPIGYLLDKGGLPTGGDRPLVYSWQAADGLDYAHAVPLYHSYRGDGDPSASPERQKKKLGQFRDVAAWPTTWPSSK